MVTYFGWLLAALLTAQFLWVILRHFTKFRKYQKLWQLDQARFMEANAKFMQAMENEDRDAMAQWHLVCGEALERQKHYMRAQRAVMDDNFIAPWRWAERWNADYLKETA